MLQVMKKLLTLVSLSFCAVIAAGSWHAVSARAMSDEDGVSSSGLESTRETLEKQREQLKEAQKRANEERLEAERSRLEAEKEKSQEMQERRDTKVAEAKKKVCQNREKSIKKIMDRTATNGLHHYEMVTKVYENVKKFAEKKNVPQSSLAKEIENADAAATAAMQAVNAVKSIGEEFTCDADAPRSAATVFLASKKAQAAALKAYRDAVKQVLVAVKASVQKTESSTETDDDTAKTDTSSTGGSQ